MMIRIRHLCWVALFAATAATAQMGPPGGGSGGGPGGGGPGGGGPGGGGPGGGDLDGGRGQASPPRPTKPLKREKFDKVVTAMFRAADANGDGTVTLDELRSVIDARRETLIRARFARIDRNRNGSIDLDEFSAWQRSLGSVALSEAQPGEGGQVREEIEPEIGKGDDDRLLRSLIEPLSATMLVNANVNYDAGVTLEELLAYERKRFDAADANHDGEISMDEGRAAAGPDARRDRGRGPDNRGPRDRDLGRPLQPDRD